MIGRQDIGLLEIEIFKPWDFDLYADQRQPQSYEEAHGLEDDAFLFEDQKQQDERWRDDGYAGEPEGYQKETAKFRQHP